ncbi:MAG: transposase family protein [Candidatus Accumulibacter sp.]|uniref:Transposase family protein n=1 Tax=Candidatus Accumulibacter proximus TaxID=2954385 RepID=A0A935Q3F8_9PROT|nr:transposase family protein [Candidatus Accumulibacter proximus]
MKFGAASHACPPVEQRRSCNRLARSWRHLDFFEYEAHLHAEVPRVACTDCGKVTQIPVPWARRESFHAVVRGVDADAGTDHVGTGGGPGAARSQSQTVARHRASWRRRAPRRVMPRFVPSASMRPPVSAARRTSLFSMILMRHVCCLPRPVEIRHAGNSPASRQHGGQPSARFEHGRVLWGRRRALFEAKVCLTAFTWSL